MPSDLQSANKAFAKRDPTGLSTAALILYNDIEKEAKENVEAAEAQREKTKKCHEKQTRRRVAKIFRRKWRQSGIKKRRGKNSKGKLVLRRVNWISEEKRVRALEKSLAHCGIVVIDDGSTPLVLTTRSSSSPSPSPSASSSPSSSPVLSSSSSFSSSSIPLSTSHSTAATIPTSLPSSSSSPLSHTPPSSSLPEPPVSPPVEFEDSTDAEWQYLFWTLPWNFEMGTRGYGGGMLWMLDDEYGRGDFVMDPREG